MLLEKKLRDVTNEEFKTWVSREYTLKGLGL